MGVHGLTTYLRENKRIVKQLVFSDSSDNGSEVPLIVDAWSFIYQLYHESGLPWVYGGEYDRFYHLVLNVVKTWASLGLQLHFVFDGPYPALKFPTVISRGTNNSIQPSLLFFRTSSVSRSTPRFLNESRILPPLCRPACLKALQEASRTLASVKVYFADGEGDPFAVELAGRLGGYVLGNDSDFTVLNAEGYKGYVPMDEVVWTAPDDGDAHEDDGNGEFQTVRNPKKKKQSAKSRLGLIPPEDVKQDLVMTLHVYEPAALAAHLHLPVTLLPLLGALVGNDYVKPSSSTSSMRYTFFERHLSVSQRFTHTATVIRSVVSAATTAQDSKKKNKQQVGSVVELIGKTVLALTVHSYPPLSTGDQEIIVEKIVEATLQYAIPKYEGSTLGTQGLWSSPVCALHSQEACPLIAILSRLPDDDESEVAEDDDSRDQVRGLYLQAYRLGKLNPLLMDILSTGTYFSRLFLENPDLETCSRSLGRPVREWWYAIIEDGLGLPPRPKSDGNRVEEDEREKEGSDEDELIDVAEEWSDEDEDADVEEDPLASLQNKLQELGASVANSSQAASTSSRSRSIESKNARPNFIVEYVRRGTRLADEEVQVKPLRSFLKQMGLQLDLEQTSIQLVSSDDRLTVLLRALGSDLPSVRALPHEALQTCLASRWVVRRLHQRAVDNPASNDRLQERWTKTELRAFLASFSWSNELVSTGSEDSKATERVDGASQEGLPPIENRNVQLVAQMIVAFESIEHFVQVLLLTDLLPSYVHRLSGRSFHAYLTGTEIRQRLPEGLLDACCEGLEEAFKEERRKKVKKARNEKSAEMTASKTGATSMTRGKSAGTTRSGFFGLLADIGAG